MDRPGHPEKVAAAGVTERDCVEGKRLGVCVPAGPSIGKRGDGQVRAAPDEAGAMNLLIMQSSAMKSSEDDPIGRSIAESDG